MSDVQQTATSQVVNDLLQLVGIDADGIEGLTKVLPPTDESLHLREQKQTLMNEYEDKYIRTPLGATTDQSKSLLAKRLSFSQIATHYDGTSRDLVMAFDALVAEFNGVKNDVAKCEQVRVTLISKLDIALPANTLPAVVEGAWVSEVKPLAEERARLASLLTPPIETKPGLPLDQLKQAAIDVDKLGNDVEVLKLEVQQRKEARELLGPELIGVLAEGVTDPGALVPGSTSDDLKPLLATRLEIATVLGNPMSTLTELNEQSQKIAGLKIAKGKVADEVAGRKLKKAKIETAAAKIVQALPAEANTAPLTKQKDDIVNGLKPLPLTPGMLSSAELALTTLREDAELETERTKELIPQRAAFRLRVAELRKLMTETCTDYDGVDDIGEQIAEIEKELKGKPYLIDFDGSGGIGESLENRVHDLRGQLDLVVASEISKGKGRTAAAPTEYLRRAAQSAADEGERLLPFAKKSKPDVENLPLQLQKVQDLLPDDEPVVVHTQSTPSKTKRKSNTKAKDTPPPPKKKAPSIETLESAMKIVTLMRSTVDAAREEAGDTMQKLTDLRAALLERIDAEDPTGLPAGFTDILEEEREAVRSPLDDQMSPAVTMEKINEASKAADRFETDLVEAETIAANWLADTAFGKARGAARGPLQPNIDTARAAVLHAGQQTAASSDLAGAAKIAVKLAAMLEQVRQEARKADEAKQTLRTAVTGLDALDEPTVGLMYDLVGPDAITALNLKPAGLKTLCACFKKANSTERDGLRDLVTEGFGGEGKVMAGLVRSNDADSILELARGYGGTTNKDARAKLRALVEQGGLAEAPTVLDDLLGYGVGTAADKGARRTKNVMQLKALGTEFGDKDGPARMKMLVADCGLGKPRPEDPPRPGILAEMLQGEDGNGLAGDAKPLRALANGYSGDTPDDDLDRARLKGLVDEGGFGNRPKAFAPLVKRLADNGGGSAAATKLKEIGTVFEGDTDRQRLTNVLEKGGMSGDTGDNRPDGSSRKHEHGDTLAKVFTDGLGSRSDKLKNFTDAFGDTVGHTDECQQMLEAWNEFPDGKKGDRQPGKKIARLMSGKHFNGNVKKLQTQFTTNIKQFDPDKAKRKLATRFAPHMDKLPAGNSVDQANQPDLAGQNDDVTGAVMGYILGRHVPAHAKDGQKMNGNDWLDAEQSYFPVDTTPGDVKAIIEEAMTQPGAPGLGQKKSVTLANGYKVEIAMKNNGMIAHCFPETGPPPPDQEEIAKFTKAEAERIFRAVRS